MQKLKIMAFCDIECAVVVPSAPTGSNCKITLRKGGIQKLVFASCDITFTDITDLLEWDAFITANKIHSTGKILGSKPKGSVTKKKVASCVPEIVTGGEKSLNFSDFNADNVLFTDYDFYNGLLDLQGSLVVGYTTCDDEFYGWIENAVLDVDDTREEDVKGNTFFEGVITWEAIKMIKPVKIPGLNKLLK